MQRISISISDVRSQIEGIGHLCYTVGVESLFTPDTISHESIRSLNTGGLAVVVYTLNVNTGLKFNEYRALISLMHLRKAQSHLTGKQ